MLLLRTTSGDEAPMDSADYLELVVSQVLVEFSVEVALSASFSMVLQQQLMPLKSRRL